MQALTTISLIFVILLTVALGQGDENYCCCCQRSGFWDITRKWIDPNECTEPRHCCNIPTKYECEIELNPTYDTSCGHVNEEEYQKKGGGPDPVPIPRDGFENPNYEVDGWFIHRVHDALHNEVQLWCINNGENYSFYLYRFVECDGSYPNWFGRCAFPAATNTMVYDNCADDIDDFTQTVPTCFAAVEHTNIGLGSDYGLDIDHRYWVANKSVAIWCTYLNNPKDPWKHINEGEEMYYGDGFGRDDGMPPLYLDACRDFDFPQALIFATPDESVLTATDMTFSFRVNVELDTLPLPLNEFMFTVRGSDNMPPMYEAMLNNGDYWSLGIPDVTILRVEAPDDWTINDIELTDGSSFITFTYEGDEPLLLRKGIEIHGFKIDIAISEHICDAVGWIAKSGSGSGRFEGFGSFDLCFS